MSDQRFGVSTHLFHETRLNRERLADIAGHGFEAVEVFATGSHFDYRDPRATDELAEWLADLRLDFHSMHAPIVDAIRDGKWVGSFSIAAGDDTRRQVAVAEALATLALATTIPFTYLVVHVGMPADKAGPGDNQPEAARRSVMEIVQAATKVRVRVALEVIPNSLSSPSALVRTIEEELEGIDVGVCLDYGHAHLGTDVAEAAETLSGLLWTTHVHDNHGKRDEHLVPYSGTINWDEAMMTTQKIGYDGALIFEVGSTGADQGDVLRRTARARDRLDKTFITF